MNGLIEVCCGVEEEPVKSNRFFYYDDDHQGASDNVARGGLTKFLQRWSPRGKAMIALSLKNDRRSIFSSPVLKVEDARTYQCPCYQKTPQEIDFLKTTLKKHILFEELTEEELDDLVRATKKESADAGRKIVTQDELGEHMYIVQSGYLSFYCEETKQRCGTLQRGDVYGEADLLFGVKVPKTIMVDQPSVVWRLGQKCYRSVLSQHAMIADSDIKAALRKVKIFKNLPDPTINKFADSLTRVTYKKGDRIINKGEIGNIFYLIENGCVRVHDIGMGDSQQVDQILKAGESFGELALMTGEPRAANVTVESDSVTVLAMDRPTFNDSMGQLSDILDFSNRLQALRSLSIFATSSLTEVELERLAEKISKFDAK
jgi:CRP-like cAMP-binding protein